MDRKKKFSDYNFALLVAFGLIILAGSLAVSVDTNDLDEVCDQNNSVLYRINNTWQCGTKTNTATCPSGMALQSILENSSVCVNASALNFTDTTNTTISGDVEIIGGLNVSGNLFVDGSINATGGINVTGFSRFIRSGSGAVMMNQISSSSGTTDISMANGGRWQATQSSNWFGQTAVNGLKITNGTTTYASLTGKMNDLRIWLPYATDSVCLMTNNCTAGLDLNGSAEFNGNVNITGNAQVMGSLFIRNGSNQPLNTFDLVGGTFTVPNTLVTARTIFMCTNQRNGGTVANFYVSARGPANYTVTSTNILDTSTIACQLIEPLS